MISHHTFGGSIVPRKEDKTKTIKLSEAEREHLEKVLQLDIVATEIARGSMEDTEALLKLAKSILSKLKKED